MAKADCYVCCGGRLDLEKLCWMHATLLRWKLGR